MRGTLFLSLSIFLVLSSSVRADNDTWHNIYHSLSRWGQSQYHKMGGDEEKERVKKRSRTRVTRPSGNETGVKPKRSPKDKEESSPTPGPTGSPELSHAGNKEPTPAPAVQPSATPAVSPSPPSDQIHPGAPNPVKGD